jgi:hypothetical protein
MKTLPDPCLFVVLIVKMLYAASLLYPLALALISGERFIIMIFIFIAFYQTQTLFNS